MLSQFRERDQPEITLFSICDTTDTMVDLVAKILTFCYFNRVNINSTNVQDVMLIANYFQVRKPFASSLSITSQ